MTSMFSQCIAESTHVWQHDPLGQSRQHFDWIAEHLDIGCIDDWYSKFSFQTVKSTGSTSLVRDYYHGCTATALSTIYPDTQWQPWRFARVPNGFWDDKEGISNYFEWLGDQLGYNTMDDWHGLTLEDIKSHRGAGMLDKYSWSPSKFVMEVYPNLEWQVWRFVSVPQGAWDDVTVHRKYCDWLAEQLQLQHIRDWYNVTVRNLSELGGYGLLETFYGTSPTKLLSTVYEDTSWQMWLCEHTPKGYWEIVSNQVDFLEWLADKLGFEQLEQWHGVYLADIWDVGGRGLLDCYGGSLYRAVSCLYPQQSWQPWRFNMGVQKFWDDPVIQRDYLNWVGEQMGIKGIHDWYDIKESDLMEHNGYGLLEQFRGLKVGEILAHVFPDTHWHMWKFLQIPDQFWVQYVDWLKDELNIMKDKDWYTVQRYQLDNRGGLALAQLFDGSYRRLLEHLYPQVQWQPWIFNEERSEFWLKPKNQRAFLDWLAEHLDLHLISDWYTVQRSIYSRGGGGLVTNVYGGNKHTMLEVVYPHTEWQTWRFVPLPHQKYYWQDPKNLRQFFEWVENELDITHPTDWHGYTYQHLTAFHGTSLLRHTGGLMDALQLYYPHLVWKISDWMVNTTSKSQTLLYRKTKDVVVYGCEVIYNYIFDLLKYEGTNKNVQFDVWIPLFNIGIEFQGEQHYRPTFWKGYLRQVSRDKIKREIAEKNGVTIVQIPYWWNFQEASLAATLYQFCPDSIQDKKSIGTPIPTNLRYFAVEDTHGDEQEEIIE